MSRTERTGEIGYEVYLRDSTRGTELWDAIMTAGEKFRIRAIAPGDQRRLEAGIFNFGNDNGRHEQPVRGDRRSSASSSSTTTTRLCPATPSSGSRATASRGSSSASGSTASRSGVARGLLAGVHRRPRGREADERLVLASPRLEMNMGYAWVPIVAAEHGTRLEITSPTGTRVGAEVVPLPFWDPEKDVPKG